GRNGGALAGLWPEVRPTRGGLWEVLGKAPREPMTEEEIRRAHRFVSDRCAAVLDMDPGEREDDDDAPPPDDDDIRGDVGIDGLRTEDERAVLDLEDQAILLRTAQLLRGPLRTGKKGALLSHLFVDEAQDLLPLELAVLIGQTTRERSLTLAGDTAQRLFLDNGFVDWRGVLSDLGLSHVAIEPLRIAYRSTREIL